MAARRLPCPHWGARQTAAPVPRRAHPSGETHAEALCAEAAHGTTDRRLPWCRPGTPCPAVVPSDPPDAACSGCKGSSRDPPEERR